MPVLKTETEAPERPVPARVRDAAAPMLPTCPCCAAPSGANFRALLRRALVSPPGVAAPAEHVLQTRR